MKQPHYVTIQTPCLSVTFYMPAQKINGKLIAQQVRQHVASHVESIVSSGKRPPGLAVVLVVKRLGLFQNPMTCHQPHLNRCCLN